MELSKRLQAVADLVTAHYKLADIGTDHAYIPIYLTQQKKITEAVALDVNEGPLQRAEEHIRENGLEAEIETRLSNGFQALQPGEVQSAVIAGSVSFSHSQRLRKCGHFFLRRDMNFWKKIWSVKMENIIL